MIKRAFDILFSITGLLIISPVLVVISACIAIDSRGGIFFRQMRVGKNNSDFKLFKFRTMRPDSDKKGLITIGARDSRVTAVGYYLRKYKLDELPQLLNVLFGTMSFVGPRPEVRKYVDMYNPEQLIVLNVKPGITDTASIYYSKESELLAKSTDPEKTYISEIMPHKLTLNLQYIEKQGLIEDVRIILLTLLKIVKG